MSAPEHTALRDAVQQHLDVRWSDFQLNHPHLAAAIDRIALIDQVVERIAADPAYQQAMQGAAVDAAALAAGREVMELIETWVRRLLAL